MQSLQRGHRHDPSTTRLRCHRQPPTTIAPHASHDPHEESTVRADARDSTPAATINELHRIAEALDAADYDTLRSLLARAAPIDGISGYELARGGDAAVEQRSFADLVGDLGDHLTITLKS